MTSTAVPILDFEQRAHPEWLGELDRACGQWGCFLLKNHDIDEALCHRLLAAMSRFFALPHEDKLALERSDENPWGFYDRELTKNVQDWKQIFDVGPSSDAGPFQAAEVRWPTQLSDFRETVESFFAASQSLSLTLLEDIGQCLGAEPGTLSRGFIEGHSSFLRLNYYPPCDEPENHLGISHHTDAGALTVLLHDGNPGLQFLCNGEWHAADAAPGDLFINIGDIVQVWSNDRYRAPLHRVLVSTDRSRYSAPFFLNPSYKTDYAPLAGALNGQSPRYRPINWGEFRAGRAAGDYADVGEEIQISDFKVA